MSNSIQNENKLLEFGAKTCSVDSHNWSSKYYVVSGITFDRLMLKIRYMDVSWAM